MTGLDASVEAMSAIKIFRSTLSMRSSNNILAATVQGTHHHEWRFTMCYMKTHEIMEVSGESPASQLSRRLGGNLSKAH